MGYAFLDLRELLVGLIDGLAQPEVGRESRTTESHGNNKASDGRLTTEPFEA